MVDQIFKILQILDYKEHALTVTKQRKDENEAYTSTVNNLERKCAELKQQVGIQYIENILTKKIFRVLTSLKHS